MRRLLASLQVRLILLVLVTLLPAAGILYSNSYNQRREQTEEVWRSLSTLVSSTAEHLAQAVEGAHQLLTAAAELPAAQSHDRIAGTSALVHLNLQNPQYLGFGMTDTEGQMFASSPPNSGDPDRSDRQWFKQAMAFRRFSTTDSYTGRITSKPSVAFSYPDLNPDGSVRVVLTAALNLERIQKSLEEAGLPPGSTQTVIDGLGNVLAQSPNDGWLGKNVADTPLGQAVLTQKTGRAELDGLDGVHRLYAFQPVAGADEHLFVVIGFRFADVLAGIDASLRRSLFILLGAGLLALSFATALSAIWVAAPVRRLVAAANRLSEGDLKARSGLGSSAISELSALAQGFDSMAAKLEEREAELSRSLTEREAIAAALRQSEERYRAVVEDQTEMISRFRPDTTLTFVNNAYCVYFGRPRDKLIGHSFLALVVEEDRERLLALLGMITPASPIAELEHRHLTPEGMRWHRWSNRGIFDANGRLIEYQGVGRDVTERKEAEDALRASEEAIRRQAERLAGLAGLSQAFAEARLDLQTIVDTATDRAMCLLGDGAAVQKLMDDGRHLTLLSCAHRDPEKAALVRSLAAKQASTARGLSQQAAATGKPVRVSAATGSDLRSRTTPEQAEFLERVGVHSVIAVPLLVQGGVVGTLTVSRENPDEPYTDEDEAFVQQVADRIALAMENARLFREVQEAEATVRRLNAELEQRVRERTADLQTVNQELEAFIYSVSHDLRSPLRAISAYSMMVQEECGAGLDEEGRRKLGIVDANAQRLARLVDGLLNMSQLGRAELRRRPVEMQPVVEQALREAQEGLPDCRIKLRVGELPWAQGDPELLGQVWVNLLSNAVKFSRPKGAIRIEIGGTVEGDEAVYYVQDHGIGFDMRYADKLFHVFERLHSDDEIKGTGIGLALVKRIVGRHGGRIWAEGEVGKGACFHFTLPAHRS